MTHKIDETKYLYDTHYSMGIEKCCQILENHEMQFHITDSSKSPILFLGVSFVHCPFCGKEIKSFATGQYRHDIKICECGRSYISEKCYHCQK